MRRTCSPRHAPARARIADSEVDVPLTVAGSDGAGTVVLRQEDLVLGPDVGDMTPVPVAVVARVYRGAEVVYVVALGGHRLRVVAPRHASPVEPGPAALGWRDGAALWLSGPPGDLAGGGAGPRRIV